MMYNEIKKVPDIIYFDYDGTINDNDKYIKPALQYAIQEGFTKDQQRFFNQIKEIKENIFIIFDFIYAFNLYKPIVSRYDEFLLRQKFKPVKNSIKALEFFKRNNIKMAITSTKYKGVLQTEVKKLNLDKYFIKLYGSNDVRYGNKPSKEFVNFVEKDLKMPKDYNCWNI